MYPSLYYAFKDLFGLDLPFLKMFQTFGFFVALAFVFAAWVLHLEMKRKESLGQLNSSVIKTLKGQPATFSELLVSGILGFLFGFKLLYIVLNFNEFTANTQGFLLSSDGSLLGGVAGAVISAYLKYSEKKKAQLAQPVWVEEVVHPHQLVGNITLLAAFFGLLGAKIFHNLENWSTFVEDPIGALLSFDGLTMYGGLICAAIACIWYGKKNNIPAPHLIDATAPSLMLGYGVGRFGCHFAGDGDWGINNLSPKPEWLSWLPDWAWAYDYPNNVLSEGVPLPGCEAERYCAHLVPSVFPTPLYEAIICIFLFFILWSLRKRITTPGVLFSLYLILNGLERFFIEKIRVNTEYVVNDFHFTQAELISTILFLLGVVGIIYFRKKSFKRSS